ncbi:hypothetical protein J4E90_007848 [Alternaria incomplexa]|uniref:uncharacterized protein n=1 Tax=Alternaria incomplexa TaxID=1187928 RepID=UPI00221E5103|nr:uncharacterized protein J4E90_007848 [Alternaria incomplexa]KAI4910413.1 hypothetical protein J4E90_007848 [Alternaria incomplexa]
MTQQDPNWNPPRGLRNRYPHRRGHVQASSDPNPAPQILQPQSQHTESTRNPQRNSDPFQYDTQTMPYWDDASGAIHDISNATPRNLDRAYAKNVAGETGTTHSDQQQQDQVAGLQTYGQHQWHNPYAEIVGGGPYAQDQVTHPTSTSTPPKNTSRTATTKDNKGDKRDFTPYFDAADPRNHTDLKSPDKYNFLGTKDVNQKIRQDTTDAIKLATEKRGKMKPDQPLPSLPEHEAQTAVKRKSAPLPPILPRFAFENPTIISAKLVKSRTASFRKSAEAQHNTTPLSAIDEAPSPLNASNKRRSVDRTPTLDRVLALRAEEQAKALAKLEGDVLEDKPTDDGEQHIPRELVKRIGDSESRCIPRVTSREEKRHASEFVPGMEVAGRDEREGICMMDDLDVRAKEEDGAGSSVYSSVDNAQEDEIETLTKAIAGLKPFQDLPPPSSSPKKKAFERQSAVPVGLDVAKLGKGKGGLGDGAGSKTKPEELGGRTQVEAEAELLKVLNATNEISGGGSAGVGTSQENSSVESFATVSSDDYEQIRAEDELASEQNGVKRRWYKGFRKV